MATETHAAPTTRGPQSTAAAILAAAETQFVANGYQATRVSEVARMADVSIGSIYVHFVSKEGLYGALVERALECESRYFDAVFDNPDIPDLEKIIALGEAYLQFFREQPAYFRMLMIPHDDLPEEAIDEGLRRQTTQRGARQRARVAQAIEGCIAQGVLRPTINPEHAANFWWAAWNGMISLTMRQDQLALTEDELEKVVIEGRVMIAEGMAGAAVRGEDGEILPEVRGRLVELRREVLPPAAAE